MDCALWGTSMKLSGLTKDIPMFNNPSGSTLSSSLEATYKADSKWPPLNYEIGNASVLLDLHCLELENMVLVGTVL